MLPQLKIKYDELPVLRPGSWIALDLEITGADGDRLHRPTGEFAFLSAADLSGTVYIIRDLGRLNLLFKNIEKNRCMQIYHNALFDIRQLNRWTTVPDTPIWDTMLMEQNLFGGYYTFMNLAALSGRWLGVLMEKEVREEFNQADVTLTREMYEYGAKDAWATVLIADKQAAYMKKVDQSLYHRYARVEMNMISVVLSMKPVKVDVSRMKRTIDHLQKKSDEFGKKLGINVNSTREVHALLKSVGVVVPNTQKETLQKRAESATPEQAKTLQMISDSRSYKKIVGTYGHSWIEKYVEDDGYVYANWKISEASTGRMACSDPNLQNIPVREFPVYRTFFVASDKDHTLLISDVSQQEPRINAKLSGDANLTRIFVEGGDSHTIVARQLYNIPEREKLAKDDDRRSRAKSINLGLSYGLSAVGLASRTGMTKEEAKDLIDRYFQFYPGIKQYMYNMRRYASQFEYVSTIMGKRCWVNRYYYGHVNNAVNSPIQGSAAEMMKIALIVLLEISRAYNKEYPVCLVVHDEMVLDIPKDEVEFWSWAVTESWKAAGREIIDDIPVEATITIAPTWGGEREE